MYLYYYALGFFIFSIIDKKNIYGWFLLSVLCLSLKCNMYFTTSVGDIRYVVRTMLMLICAILLLRNSTKFSMYQAFILFLFLVANELMLYHISNNNFFYKNFEPIIYGLVTCQFIAILPRLWNVVNNSCSDYIFSGKDKSVVERL